MTSSVQSTDRKSAIKAIVYSSFFSVALAMILLALAVLLLGKIQKSEEYESIFVLGIQLLSGFAGGWLCSVSKQGCILRAASTAFLFTLWMLLLSLLFLRPALLPALLSVLPILPAGIAGGCVNALRRPRKKSRRKKR